MLIARSECLEFSFTGIDFVEFRPVNRTVGAELFPVEGGSRENGGIVGSIQSNLLADQVVSLATMLRV